MDSGKPPAGPGTPEYEILKTLSSTSTKHSSCLGCLGRSGCGLGCLACMIVAMLVLGLFTAWLLGESSLLQADGLIGPQTSAFVTINLNDEDPGVKALMQHEVHVLQQRVVGRQNIPQPLRDILSKLGPAQLQAFLPMLIEVTHDLPSDSEVDHKGSKRAAEVTYVISFGHLKGLTELVFWNQRRAAEDLHERIDKYRDCEIISIRLPSKQPREAVQYAYLTYVANSFVVSYSRPALQMMVDRVLSPSGAFGGKGDLAAMYGHLNHRQDLLGVISSQDDEIRHLLESLRTQDLPALTPQLIDTAAENVSAIGWEIDILSEQEFDLYLTVQCKTEEFAAQVQDFVDGAFDGFVKSKLADKHESKRNGTRLHGKIHFNRLQQMLSGTPAPATPQTSDH